MIKSTDNNYLWFSILISSVTPMLLGLTLAESFPEWRLSNYPLHATVESFGSLSAITIATLIIIMVNNNHLSRRFIMVAIALISMGLLDGFHAMLHASISFVWLHSIATMIGGMIFSTVWLPDTWLTTKRQKILITGTVITSLIIGLTSVALPEILPVMIVDNQFSLLAKLINFTGGIGFLIGTWYFIYSFYTKALQFHNESIIFANHCLLFGIAGLLFETSALWDAGWWWWHLLRLSAYTVVLIYFFILFYKAQEKLMISENELGVLNKELEQRVQERTSELEKASNAKSEFLSSMSHELRTPLNAILGFGQVLDLDTDESDKLQKENIKEILDAGHHLLTLINEVLDLSKIESGKLEINMEAVPVNTTLEHCVSMTNNQAREKYIKFIDHISNEKHIVEADPNRLKQILLNLLSNAVKYNHEAGKITLKCERVNQDRLRLYITNTGDGLTEQEISRLFTPFERLNAANNIEGTGIGLIISKHLIEMMNGSIGIHSKPRESTTVWIELGLCTA